MKVKVIECESFEDFEKAVNKLITGAKDNTPTEATLVTTEEKPKNKKNLKKVPKQIEAYIRILGQKHRLSYRQMSNFLEEVWKVNKTSTYHMLAKQIAITIDKVKYEDHISNSKELFCINLFDGGIYECKAAIKNLELIPVFRTREDAELAKSILKPLLDGMF